MREKINNIYESIRNFKHWKAVSWVLSIVLISILTSFLTINFLFYDLITNPDALIAPNGWLNPYYNSVIANNTRHNIQILRSRAIYDSKEKTKLFWDQISQGVRNRELNQYNKRLNELEGMKDIINHQLELMDSYDQKQYMLKQIEHDINEEHEKELKALKNNNN